VLLVDDDPVTRRLVRKALECSGYLVEEAADGRDGLAALTHCTPDVVLLDLMMPRMDGFEMCATMRALPEARHIPVVVFTGLDDAESINRAYEAGASTFVTKPINYLNLVYRLRYIVRSKQVADRLRDREAQLAHAQRLARIGYWEWDPEHKQVLLSPGIQEMFGLPATATAATVVEFLRLVHSKDRLAVKRAIARGARSQTGFSIEYRIVRPDGCERVIHLDSEVASSDQRVAAGAAGICQDITERRQAESRIRFLAYFDPVTGLPNRVLFKDLLIRTLADAKRHQRLLGLLLVDLDHFKRVNDTVGYDGGDRLLQSLAKRLVGCVRINDHVSRCPISEETGEAALVGENAVYRLGGDEFLILLGEIRRPEDGAKVAQRVSEVLKQPFIIDDQEIGVTSSIGISVFPLDGADPDALLTSAEAAMYHAKEQGRNGYQFFTTAVTDRARRRFSLETILRKAIERNEFELHFQPQIDLPRQQVVGVEALLRLNHARVGMIPPADFVPIAEETGLILPIGEWVIGEAARQAALWRTGGLPPLRIAVNLSAAQLKQPGFPQRIEDILRGTGIGPSELEVELTESVLFENTNVCIATLNELAELGTKIAIDDFGTGYSSLTYLRRFPLSGLKVDRSFVRDVNFDIDDAAIVNAVIALAHSLRLRVVAEGVENSEQLAFLVARGCEEAQGYLFAKPMDAAALARWLAAWVWQWPQSPLRLRPAQSG
jgi:PAS domain S-box-containing protein